MGSGLKEHLGVCAYNVNFGNMFLDVYFNLEMCYCICGVKRWMDFFYNIYITLPIVYNNNMVNFCT